MRTYDWTPTAARSATGGFDLAAAHGAEGITVAAAVDGFIEAAQAGRAVNRSGRPYMPSALRDVRGILDYHVVPELGAMRLRDVRRTDIQRLVDRLGADQLSESRIRSVISALRALYGYAIDQGQAEFNPADIRRGVVSVTSRGVSSGRIFRAIRLVLAAQVAIAAVEELEYGGHVCRSLDVVAHHVGIRCGVGRLGIAALDELGAYRMREAQLCDASVPVEHTELETLIADDGGAVCTLLSVHAGPGVELVGDLIDERRCVGHGPIVLVRRGVAIGSRMGRESKWSMPAGPWSARCSDPSPGAIRGCGAR